MSATSEQEKPGLRVAVLSCGDLGARVAERLHELPETRSVLLLTAPFRHRTRGAVRQLVRSVRHDGMVDTLRGLASRALRRGGEDDTSPACRSAGITHHHVSAFEAAEGTSRLEAFDPDLGVLAGTYVLPERVFELPRLGSVNLHTGKAPEYRGSAPAFWEMYHGEDEVGVTVHEVTSELDAGRIVLQETVPIDPAPPGDPLAYIEQYRSQVLEPAGVRLVSEAVSAVARGAAEPRPQDETRARLYGSPTRGDVWKLRARVLGRRFRRRCAHAAGRALYAAGLHRRMLGDRGVVVLYHRVTAEADGNPLACSPEEFERHCEFYARHFEVVGLGELLDDLVQGRDLGGCLAVTFDDGYRDNYTVARPILEQYDLPACFFLATGYVGSERVPRWDELRGDRPEWMSWTEVADLVERGFEVGAHTRDHVDLGEVGGEEASREIVGSREDIARRVGFVTPFFSYPFGGPEALTEANRKRVKEAGFACCLSAHGGTVATRTDPYRIPRVPVSDWLISPYHLGLQIVRR